MAMPVIGQPVLQLEPLAGEAPVIGRCASDRMHLAEGAEDGIPHHKTIRVRHPHRAEQVVRMHKPQRGRAGHIPHHGDGDVIRPDILPLLIARRIRLGNDPVCKVMDEAGEHACWVRRRGDRARGIAFRLSKCVSKKIASARHKGSLTHPAGPRFCSF